MANADVFARLGKPASRMDSMEGAPDKAPQKSTVAPVEAAAPAIKPGVYDDTDGKYQYQIMDDGNIKILRSARGKGGQIVAQGSDFHDAIMKNIQLGGAKPATVKGAAYDKAQASAPKRTPQPKLTMAEEDAMLPYGDTSYEDAMEGPTISAYEAKESPQGNYNTADIAAARSALVSQYAFSLADAERRVNNMVNSTDPAEQAKIGRLAKQYRSERP